jgi:hypothetical protein
MDAGKVNLPRSYWQGCKGRRQECNQHVHVKLFLVQQIALLEDIDGKRTVFYNDNLWWDSTLHEGHITCN